MPPLLYPMTPNQREEALQAVDLLTRPCENVCDIAFKIVRNIMYGAMYPERNELIVTPQVVTGLATLQSAVSDLSRAYIAHTDTVIGRGNSTSLEQLNISNPLSGDNALFQPRGPTPAPTIEAPVEGKKRKRAPHDKNAPKRALTPFFLFLQTARSKIAEELGEGKTAKEVQDEGGRRWREMTDDDKSVSLYRICLTGVKSLKLIVCTGMAIQIRSELRALQGADQGVQGRPTDPSNQRRRGQEALREHEEGRQASKAC